VNKRNQVFMKASLMWGFILTGENYGSSFNLPASDGRNL
jgi:hypothetical protein